MKEQRPIGITILAVLNIFSGIGHIFLGGIRGAFMILNMKNSPYVFYAYLSHHNKSVEEIFSLFLLWIIIGLLFIISGVYLVKLKNWAKRLSIIAWLSFLFLGVLTMLLNPIELIPLNFWVSGILGLIYFLAQAYYFTRPKIKQQFK